MTATKRLTQFPDFNHGWTLEVAGQAVPKGTSWRAYHPEYGSVFDAVVVNDDGTPRFDRPIYAEAPNVNAVSYGWRDGVLHIGVIRQPRPHADDPECPGDDHATVVFGQFPMGFIDWILGETPEQAAAREAREETGAAVIRVRRPQYPFQNPNPTFVKTWAEVVFVEVDLDRVEELKADRTEPIYTADYIPLSELLKRICEGKDERGAVYRGCTSLSALMIFLSGLGLYS